MDGDDSDEKKPVIEMADTMGSHASDSEKADEKTKNKDPNSEHGSAVGPLVCTVYALVIIGLGFALPISHALRSTDGLQAFYVDAFHSYLYVMGLIFLAYMHCHLFRRKFTEIPARAACDRAAVNHYAAAGDDENASLKRSSYIESDVKSTRSMTEVSYEAPGVNLYRRLGAIGFGVGFMIFDGFRIAQLFETPGALSCIGLFHVVVVAVRLIFVFFQTFFLFKRHQAVINKHTRWVSFGLLHLLATNVCLWALVTVTVVSDDLRQRTITLTPDDFRQKTSYSSTFKPTPSTNSTTGAGVVPTPLVAYVTDNDTILCQLQDTLMKRTTPYLFPFVIEYTLVAASIIFKVLKNVGKFHLLCYEDVPTNNFTNMDCHKANKGLFFGLVVAILSLIILSLFFILREKFHNNDTANMVFHCKEIAILFLLFIVTLLGFAKLRHLKFIPGTNGSYDDGMLIITLFGVILFHIFLLVSDASNFTTFGVIPILAMVASFLSIVQCCVQTVFIIDGLRRCAGSDDHVRHKPGRALVTFLLLCNLSLWLINTFEVKRAETVTIHYNYYGYFPWTLMVHVCVPFIIYYRFHSTVCLSDIWINAYRKRFVISK